MNCPSCGSRLIRGRTGTKTQVGTTEVESVEQWCCVKRECLNYAGEDLSNPLKVAHRKSEITESVNY